MAHPTACAARSIRPPKPLITPRAKIKAGGKKALARTHSAKAPPVRSSQTALGWCMALMDVCESSRKWWAYEAWNTAEAPQNSTLTTILSTDESWTGTQTWRTRKHRGEDT